jgi:hypothetical protein
MNAQESIEKIINLLGLKFKKEVFASTMLKDNTTEVTNNIEDELAVGQTLYIVQESTLVPAPAGKHETREGLVLTLDEESTIIAIMTADAKDDAEIEVESGKEMKMTRAESYDGQILESPTFDVGEDIFVVGEGDTTTPAPSGEYQVVLKDESGNENKIRLQVSDGKITERENVEEETSDEMKKLRESMSEMVSLINSMNGKFKTEITSLKEQFEAFKKSPERKSVEEKKHIKETFADYKLNVIKSALKNK